ncbi:unnamed protein product, partial [Medioppia subpectinata]
MLSPTGLSSAIFGPVMLDFKYILNVSVESITLCMTFAFVGYMMGTLCNASVLQFIQFGYGFGTIVSPLILRPYLRGDGQQIVPQTHALFNTSVYESINKSNNTTDMIDNDPPIALILMYLTKPYNMEELMTKDTKNITGEELNPRRLVIILFAALLSAYTLIEFTLFDFGATFLQYTDIKLSAKSAAEIMSSVSLAYTIGRAINL